MNPAATDGFVAGPNQSVENPIGEGGMRLHQWAVPTESWRAQHGRRGGERNADAEVVEEATRGVAIAGGASTVQQYLAAGLLDELYLHIVPVILGAGERLLDNVGDPTLEPVKVVASPAVTHVKYRVVR
jgi:dihydrofolate reductase